MNLWRTKPIDADLAHEGKLHRVLGPVDLTVLGIGCIIGAGIFVLTGHAAATYTGPGIVISYVIAGLACAFSALAYAELAAAIGGCGSAYGYSYAGLGEFAAWIIGWDLILEYGVSVPAVALGWASYVNDALISMGLEIPPALLYSPYDPHTPGVVNLPAILVILFLGGLLSLGVRISAHFNATMVAVKIAVLALFIGIAAFNVDPINWTPFLPFGWDGVMKGAALIFFAYIGFDAVSTAAEEARNPARDLPIGILASLAITTLIYIIVSGLLTGIVPYSSLGGASPVASALLDIGYRVGGAVIAVGAIAGLTTVMLVLYYGLTRVFLAVSRDGLLPPFFADIFPRTRTPMRIIMISGVFMALIAGFTPIEDVAQLVNIGTLAAFTMVCAGVIVLRFTRPEMKRPFRTPFSPLIPALGMAFCIYLMANLPWTTWTRFFVWLAIGLVIYFSYSRFNSILAKQAAAE